MFTVIYLSDYSLFHGLIEAVRKFGGVRLCTILEQRAGMGWYVQRTVSGESGLFKRSLGLILYAGALYTVD